MGGRSLFGVQSRLWGPPWCSPNSSKQYYFSHIAPQTALLCGQTALGPTSLPLWCQNHGIIGCTIAKLMIPVGHDHTLAPIFRVLVTQNCILDGLRGLSVRLLPLTGPLRKCFILQVCLTKVLAFYRSALTKNVQITYIVSPVTVQPLAMCLSMHLMQNFFLWAPIFRVCVTQNGNLDGLRCYLGPFCR